MPWNVVDGWIDLDLGQSVDIQARGHATLCVELSRDGRLLLTRICGDRWQVVEATDVGLYRLDADGERGESLAWG